MCDSGTLSGTSHPPRAAGDRGRRTEDHRAARRQRHPHRGGRGVPSTHQVANPNTHRAYASAIDRTIAEIGGGARRLADVSDTEIGDALATLWGASKPATWNRNRAAVSSWLTWCQAKKKWAAPAVPADAERRRGHVDHTKAVGKTKIHRLLSRRDIPLRERTLWQMLYETAARAAEILSLNVEDLDLENNRALLRSKGGDTE
ncbi:tyrosine-type recombinase/integrase [Nonomuraea sp. NPDC046570]|uniref:tyrosine-type recombinase/integrase n=1 Tax=Nonomuraea sp. NPDC046570 TaxID=3155255 RepID=UPI0033FD69EF